MDGGGSPPPPPIVADPHRHVAAVTLSSPPAIAISALGLVHYHGRPPHWTTLPAVAHGSLCAMPTMAPPHDVGLTRCRALFPLCPLQRSHAACTTATPHNMGHLHKASQLSGIGTDHNPTVLLLLIFACRPLSPPSARAPLQPLRLPSCPPLVTSPFVSFLPGCDVSLLLFLSSSSRQLHRRRSLHLHTPVVGGSRL